MTKRDVFELLKLISVYYESYEINQEKVDQWFKMLKDYQYGLLERNLRRHVACSPYAPKVSDLIRHPENGSRAIPNVEETRSFLKQNQKPASEEVVQRSLAKIREILCIKGSKAQ